VCDEILDLDRLPIEISPLHREWQMSSCDIGRSIAELKAAFGLERCTKHAAVFDNVKLEWMNGQYIRKTDDEIIFQSCLEYLWDMGGIDEDFMATSGTALKRMLGLVKPNLKTINEAGDQILYFLGDVHVYDPEGLKNHLHAGNLPIFEDAAKLIQDDVVFSAMELEDKFRAAAAKVGRKFGEYVHPLRLAITGRTTSPSLFEVIEILGKERCLERIRRFMELIRNNPSGLPPVAP